MKKLLLILLILLISCSKPDTAVKQGEEGFVVGTGDVGVVLAHGLGADPWEVKGLSDYLAGKNITVFAVRLAGHGTSVEDLNTKTWEDWYANYKEAYLSVKSSKKKVFAGGMSLGGLLALKLAEDEDVDGVIALAPAFVLRDTKSNYAWFLKYFIRYKSRIIPEDRKQHYYLSFPVASVAEMMQLSKITENDLSKVDEPTLIMQYTNDTTVNPESAELANSLISSKNKRIVWITGTGHVFLLDEDKEKYFEQIYQFIKANS